MEPFLDWRAVTLKEMETEGRQRVCALRIITELVPEQMESNLFTRACILRAMLLVSEAQAEVLG
jgi:hypothetical protein